ncbi:MAG: GntR family transcriptional regulator [Clostridium sp.]|uniref:GntR family transcriptional regulator n=1 Tax=Clostridium culturomicium TaxID=1499683 RepID=UPI00058FAB63|nr:GntR family transcriptional regulator [Clostridium culturomicium]MDU4892540.1 GntR family transcriptional regulator [Clostridium sp.]MDU7084709.1 GntR family transcriptional regulator [Clostridium sp.]
MDYNFKKIDETCGKSMRELVLGELRNAIFMGYIKPGDRLVETTIANSMGISRTPVREALRQLESEGLAINMPRKGTVVKGICVEDAREIYEIREVLEGLAARGACLHISRMEIRELRQIIRDMDQCIKNKDEETYSYVHNRFNRIIIDSSKNKRLIDQMESIYEYLKSLRRISLLTEERKFEALKEHIEIVNAIENGDEDEAEKLTRLHVRRAKKSFQEVIEITNK